MTATWADDQRALIARIYGEHQMKKILMGLVAVSCLTSFVAPAFAGDDAKPKKEKKEKKAPEEKK